jgi:hypothetical protein
MRFLRGVAAIPVFVIATVLLIVAVVLCVTILLLPLGVPLAFLAIRLYAAGVRLLLPRHKDVKRGLRAEWRRRTKLPKKRMRSASKGARKRLRKVRKAVPV